MRSLLIAALSLSLSAAPALSQGRRADAFDLTGRWALTVSTRDQTGSSEVTLVQRGDSLIGKYWSQATGDLEVVGNVSGRDFSFHYTTTMNGQPLTFTVKGIVQTADSLSGTATLGPLGAASFSARRQKLPEPRQ